MANGDDFPTNLTDEEKAAGFAITRIPVTVQPNT